VPQSLRISAARLLGLCAVPERVVGVLAGAVRLAVDPVDAVGE
jgi:hypothetical protein